MTDYELLDEPDESLIAMNCTAPSGTAMYLVRCFKAIVSIHTALRAEREAREALAARVAALEAAQVTAVDDDPVITLPPRSVRRGTVTWDAQTTPLSPASTDEAVEAIAEELCAIAWGESGAHPLAPDSIFHPLARHVLAREAKLREELEQRTDLALRYVKRLHDAEAECDALRAELDVTIEEREALRTGWGHEATLRDEAEAEREALRARLYALEPLVAEIVSERRAHPQDFVRNRAASGSALFRLVLHERERARRAEASDGE